jgi:hypothetical protein
VQVVIALIVTPEGFPLAYEVMPGNTLDKTTLADFLKSIEQQYGKARRTWVMDRGIPTEETLSRMRTAETPIHYLVGTPRGRLSKLEKEFLTLPWEQVRDSVEVKLIEQAGELYILSRSGGRVHKERAMRRRRLKRLWKRLREIQQQKLTRDDLLLKLGAAKKEAGQAYRLIDLHLPAKDQAVTPKTFTFALNRNKLRIVRRREGSYLLRSNLTREPPARFVALLHPTDRDRAGLQRAQERSVHPSDLSPERRAYRSAHLRRFHGILSSGNPQTLATRTGAGLSPESGTGKVCGHADGRYSSTHHRWALPHPASLYTTRPRSTFPLVSDEIGTTSTVTPQDHLQGRSRGLTKA